MDIIGPEGIVVDTSTKKLVIKSCDSIVLLRITLKGQRVDRAVRALNKVIIPV